MTDIDARYWLNGVLDGVEEKYSDGEVIISSGISPSASYHLGHFRELLSANMIKVGLEMRGRKAKHLHVVDNFDPLRKRYDFLPEEFEKYVGWPVCLVPDPSKCHESYAEHYFQEFYHWIEVMELDLEVIRSYEDLYKNGKLIPQIEIAVEKTEIIKRIFKELSNRELKDDWAPIQILSDTNSYDEWKFVSINKAKGVVTASDGEKEHEVSYRDGKVKLNWRLDWPARWQQLGVMVEPHGYQEHGASGGSFQTGQAFAREVFEFEGPLAGFQYGHVHLPGDNIKMSSSKNNLITPEQAFKIVPPELVRYFYARYPGKKKIIFDPGLGLINMMDEYSLVDQAIRNGEGHEFEPAYNIANANTSKHATSSVPYSHLINVYQAALGDEEQVMKLLGKSGYEKQVKEQTEEIKSELKYVENWLKDWAPEDVKFELQNAIPKCDLTDEQKQFLLALAEGVEAANDNADGKFFHGLIHEKREKFGLEPVEAFKTVYNVLLDQDFGPKAGMFLSILDREFLVSRFKLKA